jgi:molybdopterin molybdotransferase
MLSFEEARERCLTVDLQRRSQMVNLDEAAGRTLFGTLKSPHPSPKWNNSAMDGYAVRWEDTRTVPASLQVVETIAAGQFPVNEIFPGCCAKIMTGAPMPKGADAVVIRENTRPCEGGVLILQKATRGNNVRKKGEEFEAQTTLLESGTVLSPGAIGLCATMGLKSLPVHLRPVVGIVSTGDELKPVGSPLRQGEIWSSNNHALRAAVSEAGGVPVDCGIAGDSRASIRKAFTTAIAEGCDLVLSTGGVSVGDFDLVKDAMVDLGVEMDFWKVKMKPGKPLAMGRLGETALFGLPGNPVSCMVSFYLFVRPLIRRALGVKDPFLRTAQASLQEDLRKKHGRAEFYRIKATLEDGRLLASLTGNQSSAWISSLAKADALLHVPEEPTFLKAGTAVQLRLLP